MNIRTVRQQIQDSRVDISFLVNGRFKETQVPLDVKTSEILTKTIWTLDMADEYLKEIDDLFNVTNSYTQGYIDGVNSEKEKEKNGYSYFARDREGTRP